VREIASFASNNNSVHFSSYIFTCKPNIPEANYRVSRSKERKTTKYYKQNKN
jgi:hypothetical protein